MKTVIEMNDKRYYCVDYDEEYYIFDSQKISKKEVEEKAEYSYNVFADSLTSEEIVELLNENEHLKQRNNELAEQNWMVNKIIIEYDTTDKYKDAKDVVKAIKEVMGLVMIE